MTMTEEVDHCLFALCLDNQILCRQHNIQDDLQKENS